MTHNTLKSRIDAEPSFEELRRALPAELQWEFDGLGKWMSSLPSRYPGGYGENSYDYNSLSSDEKERHARFVELSTLARHNLIEVIGWTPPEQPPATKGLLRKLQSTFAEIL